MPPSIHQPLIQTFLKRFDRTRECIDFWVVSREIAFIDKTQSHGTAASSTI